MMWFYSILKIKSMFSFSWISIKFGTVHDFLKVKKVIVWKEVTTFMVLERPVMARIAVFIFF